jgi:transposase InsO family protein
MDERLRFVARLLEGEKMAPLCREFGISRVTGYKIFERYKACGLEGLPDRSRRPYRHANQLPYQVERTILGIKKEHPFWGAPKIRDKLVRQFPMIKPPAVSTVHAVLDRSGLVKRRKRRRHNPRGTELRAAHAPNGLWCADFKGEFRLGNKQYCYPLTITDYRSRYLLACESLSSTRSELAFSVFERTFKDFGLPATIRTDNRTPFAAPNALFGLSKLAVWWLRLGIGIQRIKPGCPQQNGRHERMHLTLKKEATKPASFNLLRVGRTSGVSGTDSYPAPGRREAVARTRPGRDRRGARPALEATGRDLPALRRVPDARGAPGDPGRRVGSRLGRAAHPRRPGRDPGTWARAERRRTAPRTPDGHRTGNGGLHPSRIPGHRVSCR